MDGAKIVDLIDEQGWVDPAAGVIATSVAQTLKTAGPLEQPLRNFLHGAWLGHPLHPVLTDIPIGAWTVTAVLDTYDALGSDSASAGADAALAIGLAGAAMAAVTGLADWSDIEQGSKSSKVGAVHAVLNLGATVLYTGSLFLRRSKKRTAARIFAAAGYCLVGASSYLGGLLVTSQKIGVDHAVREGYPEDWVDVLHIDDLVTGNPKCAKAGDIDIVLVKNAGKVYALANACSHLGGPLCEGSVKGAAITCPWHKSKFDLTDGAVINGPATSAQPAFETRIKDGRIEVRPSEDSPKSAFAIG